MRMVKVVIAQASHLPESAKLITPPTDPIFAQVEPPVSPAETGRGGISGKMESIGVPISW